jgi:hypothetical protein
MTWILVNYAWTAFMVVLISEIAKRSENRQSRVLSVLVRDFLLPRIGFRASLAACIGITVACFGVFAAILKKLGIGLL